MRLDVSVPVVGQFCVPCTYRVPKGRGRLKGNKSTRDGFAVGLKLEANWIDESCKPEEESRCKGKQSNVSRVEFVSNLPSLDGLKIQRQRLRRVC